MLNTTPAAWVTNETVTATKMNTEIRDALTNLQAAWTAYTPAWTATTTNPTLGNGTITGKYTRIGKLIIGRISLLMGSTTTFGAGAYRLSLPVTPHADNYTVAFAQIGNIGMIDTSASSRAFRVALCVDATTIGIQDASGVPVSPTAPWTWANGDGLVATFEYEAA